MMFLNRKPGECICIGDDIVIRVIRTRYGQVSLGVQAPREVPVDRLEIWEAKQKSLEESRDTNGIVQEL